MNPSTVPPPPAPVPRAGTTALDPAALARWSGAVPRPGPAADLLVAAARALAAALPALLPAAPGHPAGGRSAPLAEALAEHWAGLGRGFAHDVDEHVALVAATAAALVDEDGAYGRRGVRR